MVRNGVGELFYKVRERARERQRDSERETEHVSDLRSLSFGTGNQRSCMKRTSVSTNNLSNLGAIQEQSEGGHTMDAAALGESLESRARKERNAREREDTREMAKKRVWHATNSKRVNITRCEMEQRISA